MNEDLAGVEQEIGRVFEIQMKNKWKLRESTSGDRIEKLKSLLSCIMKYQKEISAAIYKDFKKPEEEVLLTEIYPVTSEIKHTIKHLPKWMKDKKVRTPISHFGSKGRIRYEPRGVSLIISPWNFPFQLTMDPLVSAIAAGNCAIVKPSEFSPNTTACMRKIITEVFKEDEVAVFEGDQRVSGLLLEKPLDNIFFTGSPSVGRIIMEAAAKNLTTVTLELGGKSPVIVDESADMDIAAKRVAWGKCLNAGQICVAPDYLFVPEDKKDEFVRLMVKHIKNYYGNIDSNSKDLSYCRIITKRHFTRIKGLVETAVNKGAKLEYGGYYDEEDNLISPTILTGIHPESEILEEEIFGPVLPIITYSSMDEVVEAINSRPKPLALYIFSRDKKRVKEILNRTESGDTVINDVVIHVGNTNLPFGGFNNSGIGKTHGHHGFMAFTHERSLLKQGKISPIAFFYPPFSAKTRKWIEKLIKYF